MNQGVTINHDLKGLAIAQVTLLYKGRHVPPGLKHVEIECEVYQDGDKLRVHAVCPKCRHALWIDGSTKHIEYDPDKGLFIEPFTCPWEMDQNRREFGMSLCRLTLAYDGKIAKGA